MLKSMRLRDATLYKVARTEVLLSDDPELWITRDGLEMTLGICMQDIQEYVKASFNIDTNPLTFLRVNFPDFVWSFHEDKNKGQLARIFGRSDYIWFPYWMELIEGVVTATQRGVGSNRRLCFLPSQEKGSGLHMRIADTFPGLKFVLNGDDGFADTIIL